MPEKTVAKCEGLMHGNEIAELWLDANDSCERVGENVNIVRHDPCKLSPFENRAAHLGSRVSVLQFDQQLILRSAPFVLDEQCDCVL